MISGANFLCGAKLGSMSPEKLAHYVEAENVDAVHQELRAGRPVIVLLSHIGNWEVIGPLMPHYMPYARTLLASVARCHPEADLFLGLADEKTASEDFYPANVEILPARELRMAPLAASSTTRATRRVRTPRRYHERALTLTSP